MKILYKCEICNNMFSHKSLCEHIPNEHNISCEDYYNKFIKQQNEDICSNPKCNNKTKQLKLLNGYSKYCSRKCVQSDPKIIEKRKQTNIKRYGCNCSFNIKENIEKTKQKNLKLYGVEYYFQTEEFKEKSKQTNIDKYGYEFPWQNKDIKNKRTKTRYEIYGNSYNNLDKMKQTNIERYGVENIFQDEKIKQKIKHILIEKYGVENSSQIPEVIEKRKQTYKLKTGYDFPAQNPETYRHLCKYKYNDIFFDSSWELIFYLYLSSNKIEFEYHPSISFEYKYENIKALYFPDFKVNNKYVEIKGLQFFENKNPNGKMINPYNRNEDAKYEAKHQCMIKNNVKIITDINCFLTEEIKNIVERSKIINE